MTKSALVERMLLENNGYLLTSQVVDAGISKTYFKEIIGKLQLEKVAKGIYISPDIWPDELYIDCLVSKTIIFSHETALYLHELMEREPAAVWVTVPRTYNATALRKKGYRVSSVTNDLLDLGKTKVKTNYGNDVRVYDMDLSKAGHIPVPSQNTCVSVARLNRRPSKLPIVSVPGEPDIGNASGHKS